MVGVKRAVDGREGKVDESQVSRVVDEDVGGFEVAVDDAGGVNARTCFEEMPENGRIGFQEVSSEKRLARDWEGKYSMRR